MAAKKKAKVKRKRRPKSKIGAARALVLRESVAARLRKICLGLPDATEGLSFGNLAFRAGKRPFVVVDRYKGADCIFLYVDPGLRRELLADTRFFKAPYDPREKGLCRSLEAIDWRQMKALILYSYRAVTA